MKDNLCGIPSLETSMETETMFLIGVVVYKDQPLKADYKILKSWGCLLQREKII
jgi:hypothetical protein